MRKVSEEPQALIITDLTQLINGLLEQAQALTLKGPTGKHAGNTTQDSSASWYRPRKHGRFRICQPLAVLCGWQPQS